MSNTPRPSEGGLGWHTALSGIIITATIAACGWLVLQVREAMTAQHFLLAGSFGLVVILLVISIVLGGKGIQAAGRYTGADDGSKDVWLKKTRARFSYQVLILIPAALIWFGSGFLPKPDSDPPAKTLEAPKSPTVGAPSL